MTIYWCVDHYVEQVSENETEVHGNKDLCVWFGDEIHNSDPVTDSPDERLSLPQNGFKWISRPDEKITPPVELKQEIVKKKIKESASGNKPFTQGAALILMDAAFNDFEKLSAEETSLY